MAKRETPAERLARKQAAQQARGNTAAPGSQTELAEKLAAEIETKRQQQAGASNGDGPQLRKAKELAATMRKAQSAAAHKRGAFNPAAFARARVKLGLSD